jgi:hypothetical protein
VERNLFTIHKWGSPAVPRDRRCDRADCIFPSPVLRFDQDRRGVVALWSWVDVKTVIVPKGIRVKITPTVSFVPISFN